MRFSRRPRLATPRLLSDVMITRRNCFISAITETSLIPFLLHSYPTSTISTWMARPPIGWPINQECWGASQLRG
jgi:hypothetical protein